MSVALLVYIICNSVCTEADTYSYGRLYLDVQAYRVLKDPQDLLRMRLAKPENQVMREYDGVNIDSYPPRERKALLENFLKNNFLNKSGLELWKPPDVRSRPKFFGAIKNSEVIKLLSSLNRLWTSRGRKLTEDVYNNSSLYTYIQVPKPFFVSSDTVKEFSYWDSYWILQGLLACDMVESSRCILENVLSLIDRMGYCPEHNRVYSKDERCPPLLPLMMDAYVRKTGDEEFFRLHLAALDSEFDNWMENRVSLLASPFHVFIVATEERMEDDLRTNEGPGPKELFWTLAEDANLVSVRLTAVTEWSARVLAKWMRSFGHLGRARELVSISYEFRHTLNTLLKFGDCWRDIHLQYGFEEENLNDRWPLWSGLADRGCTSSNLVPATGPEALLSSPPGSLEWLSTLPSDARRTSLVDVAAALAIASKDTEAVSRLRMRPKGEPRTTKASAGCWYCYFMLLMTFLAWKACEVFASRDDSLYVMVRRRRREAQSKL